jgi:drug/metabolite transporter (DMT)-like permease
MDMWLGYLLVIAAAAVFGASSVVIKYTYLTGLSPVPVLIMQNIIALFLAWGWVKASGKSAKVPAAMLPWLLAQGAIGGFLTSVLFFTALDALGAALATLLLFTYPAFVALYNVVFRKHKMTLVQQVALPLALLGLVFSVDVFGLAASPLAGGAILLALGAAVTNAFLSINGEKLVASFDVAVVMAWSLTFSTAMLLLIYQPTWLLHLSLSWCQALLVAAGAVSFLAPLVLYLAGIKRVGAGVASIISTAEIPFTLLLAWLFLGERLDWLQLVGGFLITISVLILYRYRIE